MCLNNILISHRKQKTAGLQKRVGLRARRQKRAEAYSPPRMRQEERQAYVEGEIEKYKQRRMVNRPMNRIDFEKLTRSKMQKQSSQLEPQDQDKPPTKKRSWIEYAMETGQLFIGRIKRIKTSSTRERIDDKMISEPQNLVLESTLPPESRGDAEDGGECEENEDLDWPDFLEDDSSSL